jgi:hypothetical protein
VVVSDRSTAASLVGTGLVLGVGLGALVAVLASVNVASGAGYGISGGILVAAVVETLDRRGTTTLVPACAVAGAAVAAAVGAVAAWSHDASLLAGAGVGIIPGLLLGGFLAWTAQRG